jgi:hypothetical protein
MKSFQLRRVTMVAIIILLTIFGLFFTGLGILIIRIIGRKIFEWWALRRDAVLVEGWISDLSYLPASRNHGIIYQVTYRYDHQGKTYSKQEEVSKEFYSQLGPDPLSKKISHTTPLVEKQPAFVKCVAHHPAISRIVDPTKEAGAEKSNVAGAIMLLFVSVFGLGLFSLGMFCLLTTLHQLFLLLSNH